MNKMELFEHNLRVERESRDHLHRELIEAKVVITSLECRLKKREARIQELEDFVQAEGDAHYSHREFEKMEAERDSWRAVARSTAQDVKRLIERAQGVRDE